ncbi:MAG: hypothetical protein PHD21_03560 [Flavobacteriales bacterium]|nr:hypothetical protein [Flavobacteriales bacterium]
MDYRKAFLATSADYFVVINPKTSLGNEFILNYQIVWETYKSKGLLPDNVEMGKCTLTT